MKAIAFSLFGSDPVYTVGAVRNSALVKTVFPGWKCVFYVSPGVPVDVVRKLKGNNAIVRGGDAAIPNEMFWRFLIADDPKVERFIIRDADSRLIERDYKAVKAWEESGLPFHSIRDHPYHTLPMGGGLWGAVAGAIPNMRDQIINNGLANTHYARQTSYGLDQTFLTNRIWPLARGKVMQHDSCTRKIYPDSEPFPTGCSLGDFRFVGEIIDQDGKPHPNHWQQRISYMTVDTQAA